MNPNAAAKLKEWREANQGVKIERLDPVERAKKNPKSKVMAIKAMCWECSSAQREEIKHCTATSCPLWVHRPYQDKAQDDDEVEE